MKRRDNSANNVWENRAGCNTGYCDKSQMRYDGKRRLFDILGVIVDNQISDILATE